MTQKFTLRACRVNKGLSQKEVADYIGKTMPTIIRWEAGAAKPDKANLHMLAELYGVPVDFISLDVSTKVRHEML